MTHTHVQKVRILYKTILKLHRGLPSELQIIGTNYTRDEFRRHKTCNIKEADIFMQEWTKYALLLAEQLGLKGMKPEQKRIGMKLTVEEIEQLRTEQIYQLYELMNETSKINSHTDDR